MTANGSVTPIVRLYAGAPHASIEIGANRYTATAAECTHLARQLLGAANLLTMESEQP